MREKPAFLRFIVVRSNRKKTVRAERFRPFRKLYGGSRAVAARPGNNEFPMRATDCKGKNFVAFFFGEGGRFSRRTERNKAVRAVFDTVGETFAIAEELFSAFTALSGSSVAFAYRYIDVIARAAVAEGSSLTKRDLYQAVLDARAESD